MRKVPKVLVFPGQTSSAEVGTGCWQRWRDGLALLLGRLAHRLGFPTILRPFDLTDEMTGQRISLRVGLLFARLTVNDRDYYFRRFTGRFDGTGIGCR